MEKHRIQIYHALREALRHRRRAEAQRILITHPEIHDDEGQDGNLIDLITSYDPEFLESAFQAGLSPDAGQDNVPQTFLQHAAAEGDLLSVQLALQYGADPEKPNDCGEFALSYACTWGQFDVVRRLVEAGADVNAIEHDSNDGMKNTALDCCGHQPEIAAYLQSRGAKTYRALYPEEA